MLSAFDTTRLVIDLRATSASLVPIYSGPHPTSLNILLEYMSTPHHPNLLQPTLVFHRVPYWDLCCSQRTWHPLADWSVTLEMTSTSMQTISTSTPAFRPVQPISLSWPGATVVPSTGSDTMGSSSTQTSLVAVLIYLTHRQKYFITRKAFLRLHITENYPFIQLA